MTDHITELYCIVDDLLKAMGHQDDARCEISDSEVITTGLAAAYYFGGNVEKSRKFMKDLGFMPRMIRKSRLCRRLQRVKELMTTLFHQLGEVLKTLSASTKYLLDSFPVAVCDNIRIQRSRIVKGEEYRGYIASKRRYFYGVRVHVVTTEEGIPVEFAFLPGEANDVRGLDVLPLSLPLHSQLYMDAGYTDYEAEDIATEMDELVFEIQRKKNSQRGDDYWLAYYKQLIRKRIETVFSQITGMFPKYIHAVTLEGFLLKISLFITAYQIDKAFIQ